MLPETAMRLKDEDTYSSAQQRAYHYIRDRIVEGSLPGGDKLNPAAIAEDLGISRMPVREAIVQLDAEGLVTNRPNRGAIVTPLHPEDVEELFEMRAALEGIAARHAAERCTDIDLHELSIIAERMARAEHDAHQWLRAHDSFHEYMCSMAQRRRLEVEVRRIRSAVHPYLLIYNRVYNRVEMEGAEHIALIEALRSRNPVLAEQSFKHHVATAGVGVIAFLRERTGNPVAG
jgi:DNA-binding GntR family transcriptional regulator